MSLKESKEFFTKLKETCKNIDNNISEIKKKLYEVDESAAYSAFKCASNVQERIHKLKTESDELKCNLQPKLVQSTNFIQHFKELVADTEVSVTHLENHLKQYGYTPLNLHETTNASEPLERKDVSPIKNECHQESEDLSKTPNLLDYGITSRDYSTFKSKHKEIESSFEELAVPPMVQLKDLKKDKEKSGSTPTLEINFISSNTDEETPPLPGFVQSVIESPRTPKLVHEGKKNQVLFTRTISNV